MPRAHIKTFTKFFHLSLSAATILTSSQKPQPASLLFFPLFSSNYFFPVILFVSFALAPRLMLHFNLCLSYFGERPIIFNRLDITWSIGRFIFALSSNFSFLTLSCDWMRRILRRQLLWNALITLSSPIFIFHVSYP